MITAYQTANLEDDDAEEEDALHREVLVGFTPDRLCGCQGKEHGRRIPADIFKAVEFIRDGRDGGGDNGLLGFRVLTRNYHKGVLRTVSSDARNMLIPRATMMAASRRPPGYSLCSMLSSGLPSPSFAAAS